MWECLSYLTSWQVSQDHVVVAHWLRGAEKWWQFLAQDLPCFLPLAHQWHWLHHRSRRAGQRHDLHGWCREITCFHTSSAVWCCNGAACLWTIKIDLLDILWNQYKLATMRRNEFLLQNKKWNLEFCKSEFLFSDFPKIGIKKKIQPKYPESETKSEFRFQWGSQKSEPKIGIPNQGSFHTNSKLTR